MRPQFWALGDRDSGQIRFYYKGLKRPNVRRNSILRNTQSTRAKQHERGKQMKKLLLIALAAMGLLLVPVQRSDAQISVGVGGVGVGFGYPGYRYGYYPYGSGYYPYGYYRPNYSYYSGPTYYWSNGHRYYRHHRHNHHYYRY